ncbi:uncharacterized protein [Bos indicus]|uniref:Uncharacterized protein n=1 Tax=Bos indicus TaxID=9915 RepID=A0ABM4SRJ8_BOSIN
MGDKDTMKGAARGRRPGQQKQGVSHRENGRISSKENLSVKEKGGDRHPSERQREKRSMETQEGSQSKAEVTRHKQCRSRDDFPESHKRNGHGEEKVRGQLPPAQWRSKEHPNSCRAGLYHRAGSAHTSGRLHDRGARFRSPMWARGQRRCQCNPESRPASPKRPRRSQSPEAAAPLEELTSKLSNQMGALEVVLDELRAPGGAFLPVPTDRTEPTASQRSWLTWQLTHAGATLHWALTRAAHHRPPGPQVYPPWAPGP